MITKDQLIDTLLENNNDIEQMGRWRPAEGPAAEQLNPAFGFRPSKDAAVLDGAYFNVRDILDLNFDGTEDFVYAYKKPIRFAGPRHCPDINVAIVQDDHDAPAEHIFLYLIKN